MPTPQTSDNVYHVILTEAELTETRQALRLARRRLNVLEAAQIERLDTLIDYLARLRPSLRYGRGTYRP